MRRQVPLFALVVMVVSSCTVSMPDTIEREVTRVVERPITIVVEKQVTLVVEKPVTVIVERVVTATPQPTLTSAPTPTPEIGIPQEIKDYVLAVLIAQEPLMPAMTALRRMHQADDWDVDVFEHTETLSDIHLDVSLIAPPEEMSEYYGLVEKAYASVDEAALRLMADFAAGDTDSLDGDMADLEAACELVAQTRLWLTDYMAQWE